MSREDVVSFEIRTLVTTEHWDVEFDGSRVVFDRDSIDRVGEVVRELGLERVLLVTDPQVRRAGHVVRAEKSLAGAAVDVRVFDGVQENPTTAHVADGVSAAKDYGPDGIVGLGGGSALDCAKGVNFVLTQGGRMEDYQGYGKADRPMLPSVGVPTTAGTGTEAQSYALICRADTGEKMACGDRKAKFRAVILDPGLLETLPRTVAAVSGIDAAAHAVESFVTRRRNAISRTFSKEAWQLLERSFVPSLDGSGEDGCRARMLVGAFLAGAAIEHSMLGAAHACANPLTARYGVTHGIAVALMLPHVVRFNSVSVGEWYDELHRGTDAADRGVGLSERVEEMRDSAGLPGRLSDCSIPRAALPSLAEDASRQWTAGFNPRAVEVPELMELYEAAW